MKNFWGFYDNGIYRVGCNGATIYVYDNSDNELGRIKVKPSVYCGAFQPDTNIFVAKAVEGRLFVCDLSKMKIIKKIFITNRCPQDDGFDFSPDGKFFYNIERRERTTQTQLTVYRTSDYEAEKALFCDKTDIVLKEIEFDAQTGECYVLGFMRRIEDGVISNGFVGKFDGAAIMEVKSLEIAAFEDLQTYKEWQRFGFTKQKAKWSLDYRPKYANCPHFTLKQFYDGLQANC